MRILLLSLQFPPDSNSAGQLMSQLAEGLISFGHEVTVLTTFPHYENFRIADEYRGQLISHDQKNGVEIIRLFTYAPGKKTMLNRLLSYLTFNTLALVTALFSRSRWDVILCQNASFFTGVTGWLLGRAKKIPFVYNVQDLYPEVPIAAGQLRNSYAIAVLKKIELFMYRKAAHITVISPPLRVNLIGKKVPSEKISIVPNFVDTDFIRPLPKINEFGLQRGLSDKFVVTHAGNLGYIYDLDTMLEAASLLSSEKNILFLLVGNGVAKAALEEKTRQLKLDNVRFLPFQSYENLPWLRAASDIHVSLYKNGAANGSFPSKVYEVMASGRPLLASSDAESAIEKLVNATGCGICVRPGDPEVLAQAILKLYRNPSLRERMGASGRRYAEKNYSKHAVVARYHELFHKVSEARDFSPRAFHPARQSSR